MKKLTTYLCTAFAAIALLIGSTGCITNPPSQATIDAAALVVKQAAYQGAAYAIQQNTNNAKWFVLADSAIKTFATGQSLTPDAFETALSKINPALQNQWVQLAIDSTVLIYDVYYGQYVVSQVNSNAVAVEFLTAVTAGFDMALGPNAPMLRVAKPVLRPSIVAV